MIELPIRSVFLTIGQLAIALFALLVALVLIFGPSGSARLPAIIGAIAVVVGTVWIIRGLRRQAIILDGDRLGWRGGLTGAVVGWTRLADVEASSTALMSSSITRQHPDVILWASSGGLTGLRAILLNRQRPPQLRTGAAAEGSSRAELRPFIVPFSAFRNDDRATMRTLLDKHGLLPAA